MTNPGERRLSDWINLPDGATARVEVVRGFDCRKRCEHVPRIEQKHGLSYDEWCFEYLVGDIACRLNCLSWLLNGKVDEAEERTRFRSPERRLLQMRSTMQTSVGRTLAQNLAAFMRDYRTLRIYGGHVHIHAKDPHGEKCDLFGRCTSDFAGFLNSARFFEPRFSADLVAVVMGRAVDDVDLALVADRMAPLWSKMAAYVMAKRTDGMIGDDE